MFHHWSLSLYLFRQNLIFPVFFFTYDDNISFQGMLGKLKN